MRCRNTILTQEEVDRYYDLADIDAESSRRRTHSACLQKCPRRRKYALFNVGW